MFYTIDQAPRGLLNACIIPRPIAWISTISTSGTINIAPFSYFNIISESPAMIMFAITKTHSEGGLKDTLKNIEETNEFVINVATYELREVMHLTSAALPRDVSEFDFARIPHVASFIVKSPRVKQSPIQIECMFYQSVQLPTESNHYTNKMVIGKILGIHVNPDIMTNGLIDITKFNPIARIGYNNYMKLFPETFSFKKPVIKNGHWVADNA